MKKIRDLSEDEMSKYGCSIAHYLEDAYSICREERQYVVFLYNILRKNWELEKGTNDQNKEIRNIFQACGISENAVIESVFYEVTFMRDFFERNRRLVLGKPEKMKDILLNKMFSPCCCIVDSDKSFNKKLIQYIMQIPHLKELCEKEQNIKDLDKYNEINLGLNDMYFSSYGVSSEGIEYIEMYAKYMMNVKPDLAVIYKEEGKKYLLFLECKFESAESAYKDKITNGKIWQRDVQWYVADFLCKHYLNKEGIFISNAMISNEKGGKSRLVQLVRKEPKENEIEISKLIELNNRIFL